MSIYRFAVSGEVVVHADSQEEALERARAVAQVTYFAEPNREDRIQLGAVSSEAPVAREVTDAEVEAAAKAMHAEAVARGAELPGSVVRWEYRHDARAALEAAQEVSRG